MSALSEGMVRPRIALGVLLLLGLTVCAQAQPPGGAASAESTDLRVVNASLEPHLAATAVPPLLGALAAAAVATQWDDPMAERNPSVHRWPWWLRLVAVVGVLLFVRLAAGFARGTGRSR